MNFTKINLYIKLFVKRSVFLYLLTSLFILNAHADTHLDEMSFDDSFIIQDVEFKLKSVRRISTQNDNWKHGGGYYYRGSEEYKKGLIRIQYELKNKKLSKNCKASTNSCTGKLLPLFNYETVLKKKIEGLCHRNGMHVAGQWVFASHIAFDYGLGVDCIISKEDYLLTFNPFEEGWKSEQLVKINKLSINLMSIDILGTRNCNNRYHYLSFSGPVDQDARDVFERFLSTKIPRCIETRTNKELPLIIYMNSGGGFLEDGFSIGRLFRKNNIRAVIKSSNICASSCATAFLGANIRTMKGSSELLFHAPYNIYQSSSGSRSINCQSENLLLKEYYKEMLDSDDGEFLYERTMSYCSNSSGWSINNGAANLFGILSVN